MRSLILLSVWMIVSFATGAQATSVSTSDVLAAIMQVESGGNPYAIRDNTGKRSYAPASLSEATDRAKQLLALGHNIDLGLYQINSIHLKNGLSADMIFDPTVQASTAAGIFTDFHKQAKAIYGDTDLALWRATGAYNAGNQALHRDNVPYVSRVLAALGLPPDSGNRGGWSQVVSRARHLPDVLSGIVDVQTPWKWQIGTAIDDPNATGESEQNISGISSSDTTAAIALFVLFLVVIVFIKLGLLWWLLKWIVKKAVSFAFRQATKRRSLSF